MRFKIRGRHYNLLLKHHFFPVGIVEIIPQLKGMPKDYNLVVNGTKLQGKVALVTGAHKGIGFQIALRLLKDGAKVIITGRNEEALKNIVHKLNTPNLTFMVWDIADGKTKKHLEEAQKIYGKIDILVNNAGVNKIGGVSMSFEKATKEYIHSMNDINVVGTVSICKEYIKVFSSGTILNIISNTSVRAAVGIYWMSKWAIYDYTKGLSERLQQNDSQISVNGLCPGPTMTDMMFDSTSSVYYPAMANKRIGLPEEMAELAFILIVSGLKGKTGEIVVCDGGESLI